MAAVNDALPKGFRILTGIEVDILADGSLDQDEELLARLDVVVGSVHSGLNDDRAKMTRRMLTAIANPHLDILGHCTGRMVSSRPAGVRDRATGGIGRVPAPRVTSTRTRSSRPARTTVWRSRSTLVRSGRTRRSG